MTVELVVSRERYAELRAGPDRPGRWTPEREPVTLGPEVRVQVTITD